MRVSRRISGERPLDEVRSEDIRRSCKVEDSMDASAKNRMEDNRLLKTARDCKSQLLTAEAQASQERHDATSKGKRNRSKKEHAVSPE